MVRRERFANVMILTNPKERSRFLRFALVGGIGFLVDFTTFNIFTGILGIPSVLASVLSFIAAVSNNFIWNRYWTYPDSRSKKISRQVVQFALVSLSGLLIRTPIFALVELLALGVLERYSDLLPLSVEVLAHNLALVTAVIVVLFWNFFVNRFWTYSDVDNPIVMDSSIQAEER